MKFRQARHTNQLAPIVDFYTQIIGLEKLGEFENHEGYDGVFIGPVDSFMDKNGWHLEFTVSWEQPLHRPDEEDLLVFYPNSTDEFLAIRNRIRLANLKLIQPKNPYWRRNGIALLDPDGYGVVVVNPEAKN